MPATPASTAGPVDLTHTAGRMYIYGYPLVYCLTEIADFVEGGGHFPFSAPYNAFGYARNLLGPETKFVSPNNDTLYTIAMCDVRPEPLVLHVPDTHDRYYVLQFIDAWTNNFAYIGRRATGTADAQFLLVPPGYAGEIPAGMRVVRAPTGVFVIGGRIQANGEADLPAVHALQDQFALTPLSVYVGGAVPPVPAGVLQPDPRVSGEFVWWERFRVALAAFPPPAADAPFLAECKGLGLTAAESPYVEPDPVLAKALVAGERAGQAKIDELMKGSSQPVNGWTSALHMFDYNLDYFEVGSLDAPAWKIPDRTRAYVTRAVAARAGLWGNHGYEADYALAWADAEGKLLTGERAYELRLAPPPPVDAFWSLTMYDVPDFYLVANPIDRYSIGDRTPGLSYGADGSLTIYLQRDSPGPGNESNWLPAPAGQFRPVLRMYAPQQPVLDGTYVLPPIRRAG